MTEKIIKLLRENLEIDYDKETNALSINHESLAEIITHSILNDLLEMADEDQDKLVGELAEESWSEIDWYTEDKKEAYISGYHSAAYKAFDRIVDRLNQKLKS